MTKNFKGLISIWLTVIMLLGLMVSPMQVGAAGNEGEVLVYKYNITPVSNDFVDVEHSAGHYVPSDGQKLIDASNLSNDISSHFTNGIAGFEVWTYGDSGYGCGYVFYEKKAYFDKDYTLSQTDIDTYDDYGSNESYIFVPVETPEVYVGGVKLNLNVPYVNSDGTVTSDGATDRNYNAKLSVTNDGAVLAINNLDIEGQVGDFELWYGRSGWCLAPESAGIASKSDLTINVTGENAVKGVKNTLTQAPWECSAGVWTREASVTFTGTGKIDISAENVEDQSIGIFSSDVLNNGAEITASAGNVDSGDYGSYGVYTNDAVTVNSGKLTANAGDAIQNTGIYAGSLVVTGGTVTANAGDSYTTENYSTCNHGISASEIALSGDAKVTANGGKAFNPVNPYFSYGIYSYGISIGDNSVLTANGGDVYNFDTSICSDASTRNASSIGISSTYLSVDGNAKVNATAGVAKDTTGVTESIAISLQEFSMTSGNVKALASKADDSVGILSYDPMTVTGGILESEASSDATNKYCTVDGSSIIYSDGSQPDSNWYKWRTQKGGDWNISSDGNHYVPSDGGSESYVLIAPLSYSDVAPTPTPTPRPRPSSGGGISRYSVKFNTDGGSEIKEALVVRNSTLNRPEDPTKDGFIFDGWYTSNNFTTEYDFTKPVTNSFTLFAKWTEEKAVTSDGEDGTSSDGSSTDHTINCPSSNFNDVEREVWYHAPVDFVIENKIMNGIDDSSFGVNDNLTRAMFVTILYRMEGEPATNRSIPFADVDMGGYYAAAVTWAKQTGVVNGVSENEFAPHRNITRQELATMMHRYAAYKGYDVSIGESTNILSYEDYADIGEYAISAIQYAVGAKILTGNSASTLNPTGNATRAEAAAIIKRFIEYNK